jgi:glycosyltransferase involved in cell wall biosynthesis
MRVLHVMECTIGGARRHITEVARGQRAAGLEVHLVVSAERQPDFREDLAQLAQEGVAVLELPMVRPVRPGLDLAHARKLAQHLRAVRPDVVHSHSSKGGVLGRWASIRTGIGRRVYTPHTFAFLHSASFGPAARFVYRSVETWFGRRTDRTIAVSSSEADTIRAAGVVDPATVRVVPNGIDTAPYAAVAPAERAALDTPEGAPVAALVGLVYEAKGQDLALEALTLPGCEDLHLWIAGEGEQRATLTERARELGLAERAHFLGWRKDVPALLAAADFLLLPSRWEAMPYIVLEAMASAKPVVAARVDGVRDLVIEHETGLLCDVGDAQGLAAACARMVALEPDRRASMGTRGRGLVEQSFSAGAMVRGLIDVYEEVVP